MSENSPSSKEKASFIKELESITAEFAEHFHRYGYEQVPSVDITSKVDPTVRFIGAPISVMKPMLAEGSIPDPGAFMVQNCIRTTNESTLLDVDTAPSYGSFFTAMGALTSYDRLGAIFAETAEYLTERLGIQPEDLLISLDEQDQDLHHAASETSPLNVQPNTQPPEYYRHQYGIEGVRGRNISYWLRNSRRQVYEDVGNIIVIENQGGPLGVELALGDTTIVKQTKGLEHVQDCYGLDLTGSRDTEAITRKLEDVVITGLALYREGLRPSAKNNQTRILRSYIKAGFLFCRLLDMSFDDFQQKIQHLESGVLPFDSEGQASNIVTWMQEYDNRLLKEGPLSKQDETIFRLLSEHQANKPKDNKP